MNRPTYWLSVILSIVLIACTMPFVASSRDVSRPTTTATPRPQGQAMGQQLPISAQATIAGKLFQLEVARTPSQQAMGLMYRPALSDDRGMLFPFDPPQFVGFWMKNVPVPLDMVFLYKGEVKGIQNSAPPCAAEPCPTYGPNALVDQVIELRAGRAKELGVKVGDRVTVQFLPSRGPGSGDR